ncbi:MAG TPA: winged helix-turn-helix transcriptional regulator [Nitrososphaeraceae archaeon]|nr:winged helix-turn-helix transcriptional regulator [Nitrososphaeraceae archaeon]
MTEPLRVLQSLPGYLSIIGKIKITLKVTKNLKTLTARLRELEQRGLISRKAYPEVPPRVEHCSTQKGRSLKLVLEGLATFSIQNCHDRIFH